MQLNGKKCYLCYFSMDNIYKLQSYIEDEEVVRYAGFTKTMPQEESHIKKYIQGLLDNPNVRLFSIIELEKGKYIGNIRVDIEWMWRNSIISLLMDKQWWGKGIGTEAIGLITDFAFKTLGMNRVEAGVLDGNIGSIKAFERNGFQMEGIRRKRRFNEGKFIDEIMLGKLKED